MKTPCLERTGQPFDQEEDRLKVLKGRGKWKEIDEKTVFFFDG